MTPAPDHATWAEGRVVVDGVGLRYHRTGRSDRPSMILAHGLSDNGRCWQRLANRLDQHFDIVMLDARNHGRSDTASTSPNLLAEDIVAVMSALELDRPVVIGHSVGAQTMAMLAARFPDLVSRLVLEDPPWTADREQDAAPAADATRRRDEIAAWLGSFVAMTNAAMAELARKQHPDWSDDEYPAWIESNQQVRVEAAGGIDSDSWSQIVAPIACPTLLLHADVARGGIVSPSVAARVVELNANVTSAFIEGAGHNIRRENFEQYVEVVTAFLSMNS